MQLLEAVVLRGFLRRTGRRRFRPFLRGGRGFLPVLRFRFRIQNGFVRRRLRLFGRCGIGAEHLLQRGQGAGRLPFEPTLRLGGRRLFFRLSLGRFRFRHDGGDFFLRLGGRKVLRSGDGRFRLRLRSSLGRRRFRRSGRRRRSAEDLLQRRQIAGRLPFEPTRRSGGGDRIHRRKHNGFFLRRVDREIVLRANCRCFRLGPDSGGLCLRLGGRRCNLRFRSKQLLQRGVVLRRTEGLMIKFCQIDARGVSVFLGGRRRSRGPNCLARPCDARFLFGVVKRRRIRLWRRLRTHRRTRLRRTALPQLEQGKQSQSVRLSAAAHRDRLRRSGFRLGIFGNQLRHDAAERLRILPNRRGPLALRLRGSRIAAQRRTFQFVLLADLCREQLLQMEGIVPRRFLLRSGRSGQLAFCFLCRILLFRMIPLVHG